MWHFSSLTHLKWNSKNAVRTISWGTLFFKWLGTSTEATSHRGADDIQDTCIRKVDKAARNYSSSAQKTCHMPSLFHSNSKWASKVIIRLRNRSTLKSWRSRKMSLLVPLRTKNVSRWQLSEISWKVSLKHNSSRNSRSCTGPMIRASSRNIFISAILRNLLLMPAVLKRWELDRQLLH